MGAQGHSKENIQGGMGKGAAASGAGGWKKEAEVGAEWRVNRGGGGEGTVYERQQPVEVAQAETGFGRGNEVAGSSKFTRERWKKVVGLEAKIVNKRK